jgi:hypothetical protein
MAEDNKPVELREGVVYVVQSNRPSGSSFMKGDRVVMTRRRVNSLTWGYFKHEDGRTEVDSAMNVEDLMEAPARKLTRADIKPGVVYVVLKDRVSSSSFMTGDRVKLMPDSTLPDLKFRREDGREVACPRIHAEYLAFAEKEEVKVDKELTHADIKPGKVYVVLKDNPNCSDFKKGDRVKLRPGGKAESEYFVREDGIVVLAPYVSPRYLKLAEEEIVVDKKLTDADLKHGEVYVVLENEPSWSSYVKGDRVMMVPGTKPKEHHFQHADGRKAELPYVGPEYLRREAVEGAFVVEGPKWVPATPDDLKVGAVFKVEDGIKMHYHWFPVGTLVEFTGRYHGAGSTMVKMVALNGTEKGTEQWMQFSQISLLVPGTGDVIAPAPKKGTGTLRKTATRSDGHDFKLMDCGKAGYYVEAGCRWFTMADADKHWMETRKGTDLGSESFDILDLFKLHIKRLEAAKKKG